MRLVLQQGRCAGPQGAHLPLGVIEVGWDCDASLGNRPAVQSSNDHMAGNSPFICHSPPRESRLICSQHHVWPSNGHSMDLSTLAAWRCTCVLSGARSLCSTARRHKGRALKLYNHRSRCPTCPGRSQHPP